MSRKGGIITKISDWAESGKTQYFVLSTRDGSKIIVAGKIKSSKQQKYFVMNNRKKEYRSFGGGTRILDIIEKATYKMLKIRKYSIV